MNSFDFKFQYSDWFAELNHDDEKGRKELNLFFEERIKHSFSDHSVLGIDSKKQKIFHICYDCNIDLWNDIYEIVKKIGKNCKVNFDWEEIKYFLKFSFIWMPPGGGLKPHVTQNMVAMTAFNIPLRGKNVISFYESNIKDQSSPIGKKLMTYEYKKPTFLNVNKYHGVENNNVSDRLILKTHLTAMPWQKLILSYNDNMKIKIFNFDHPGLNNIKANSKQIN